MSVNLSHERLVPSRTLYSTPEEIKMAIDEYIIKIQESMLGLDKLVPGALEKPPKTININSLIQEMDRDIAYIRQSIDEIRYSFEIYNMRTLRASLDGRDADSMQREIIFILYRTLIQWGAVVSEHMHNIGRSIIDDEDICNTVDKDLRLKLENLNLVTSCVKDCLLASRSQF